MATNKLEDILEKILRALPSNLSSNRDYLKGYIDCWADNNLISESDRAELYLKYGEGLQIAINI